MRVERPGSGQLDGERGETLIEVLAAVAIMALGGVALLGALFTLVANTSVNKERTEVASFLQRWGDAVAAPVNAGGTRNYSDCQQPLTSASGASIPSGVTATWTVEYLASPTGVEPDWQNPSWTSVDGCIIQGGDRGLQKVTLYATSSGKHAAEDSLVVYRRRTQCPANFDNADLGPC